jgi:hypothetical protein
MARLPWSEFCELLSSSRARSRRGGRGGTRGIGIGTSAGLHGTRRFRRVRRIPEGDTEENDDDHSLIGPSSNVLWAKRLSRSDLQITNEGTHPTGNMKLGAGGRLIDGIFVNYAGNCPFDRNTYFTEIVFSGLDWVGTEVATQMEALTTVRIFVQSEFSGEFEMRISYDLENRATISEGDNPNRAEPPTWLHFANEMTQCFGKPDFVGGYVELCGSEGSEGPFELHFFTPI